MIKKIFKQSVGAKGESVLIRLSDGHKIRDKNTITNFGLSELAFSLLDKSLPQFYFAVGDDDTLLDPALVALQNTLQNEVSRLPPTNDISVEQQTDGHYQFILESIFSVRNDPNLLQSPAITLKEIGLFNRVKDGVMFSRSKKETPLTMDFQSKYNGAWLVDIGIGDIVSNGGIVNEGSRLICEAMRKRDEGIDYENLYYGGADNTDNYILPAPFGINLISLGTGSVSPTVEDVDLVEPLIEFDTEPTITNLDLTGEGTDPLYRPKVIIQKYIPPNTVNVEITEAALFNSRFVRTFSEQNIIQEKRTMFSRVILGEPIPANEEAVLTWEITFNRAGE